MVEKINLSFVLTEALMQKAHISLKMALDIQNKVLYSPEVYVSAIPALIE